MYNLAESIRWIALFVYPFIPSTEKEIWNRLGLDDEPTAHLLGEVRWGEMPSGTAIRPGSPLFPGIEDEDDEPRPRRLQSQRLRLTSKSSARLVDIRPRPGHRPRERVAGDDKLLS